MKEFFKRSAALVLCAALLCPAARAEEAVYTDVPAGAWYAEAVAYCRENGLMEGTDTGLFSPDQTVSRAMLAVALHRLAGTPQAEAGTFTDVDPSAWYADEVGWADTTGLMRGYGNGCFGPEDPVTREQVAVVFHRWAATPSARESGFTDRSAVSAYALSAVDWASASGLMNGYDDGSFHPAGTLTRAQLAQLLANRGGLTVTQVSAIDVMCQPCGVAAMEDGSLLVTDLYNRVIWHVSGGKATVFAGSDTVEDIHGQPMGGYHDAEFLKSTFKDPWAIAPFLDGWAVSDAGNGVVRFLRTGEKSDELTPVTDLGLSFDHPTGLATDGDGNLYVAETFQGLIYKITPKGRRTTLVSGLSEPMGLCWADGGLYVAECGGNRVLRVSANGRYTVVAGSGENGYADGAALRAEFSGPKGVAVAEDGTVYVADTDNGAVRRVRDGQVATILSRDPWDIETLFPVAPTGLLLQDNILYISDTFARKLLALPLV